MTVGHEDVRPAVVVEIHESDSPAEEPRIPPETRLIGHIFESKVALVAIERRGIAREVGLHDVKLAVAIVIGCRDSHAGLWFSVGAVGYACLDSDIGERAVVIILIKRRR